MRRFGFARAIEASVDGEAPEAARLWKAGWNHTDKGDLNFTPTSADLVMKAFAGRGNPLAWYYEHEDRIPIEQRGGAPMKGVCSAPSSDLVVRDSDTGPELWAEHIAWTAEARRQIITGERRQLSPIAAYDEDTREIVEILNVSLCAEGATHFGTILATRAGREQEPAMDEILQQLMSAIEAKDWELCESLLQQMEAADGGAMMAKMGRMAMKSAKDDGDDKDKAGADETATKRLAAALAASRSTNTNPSVLVLTRELEAQRGALAVATAEAKAATREAKVGRVEGLIAANRDAFDAVDEREHLAAADPERTRKHIESIRRKTLAAGGGDANNKTTLAANRPPEAKPPKGSAPVDETHGLSVAEIQAATAMKVTLADFAAAKKSQASRKGA